MVERPVSLSDRQLKLVPSAARAVPAVECDAFLQRVAIHLTGMPSDAAVSGRGQRGARRAAGFKRRRPMTIYRRAGRAVAEDEALDEDGILRDGYSISVPLMFRDGTDVRRIRKETLDPHGHLISAPTIFHLQRKVCLPMSFLR